MFKVSTLASRSNSDSPSFISWCHTPIEELVHEPTHPLIEILRPKKCLELPFNLEHPLPPLQAWSLKESQKVLLSNLVILEPLDPTFLLVGKFGYNDYDSIYIPLKSPCLSSSCAERRVSFPSYHRPVLSDSIHVYSHSRDAAFFGQSVQKSFNTRCWSGLVVV